MKVTTPSINKPLVKSENLFPVVGVGASAGGLDAFKKLLKAIPEDSGMAFVLVQHLDPTHESLLPDLLQKVTRIPVLEISDDIKVVPDHIYIIPSNKILIANDGVLELSPRIPKAKKGSLRAPGQRNLPIDLFFTSLAEVHQTHAIGVVLSGTASDGTAGLRAIKDHGGITFAQDKESAAYESMPESAVQAGVVDFILPPDQIPQKILEITKTMFDKRGDEPSLLQQDEEVMKQILSLLRIRKGTDFTYYKQTTIRRRILRRMALNKNGEPATYLKYLKENKEEQDILYQDLLIPVTTFFRDPKCFENLIETIFPQIIKNKSLPAAMGTLGSETIRVWVAGCSTGEEAYSIAICLKEFLGNDSKKVQIFATDISEPAIAKARNGIYTQHEVENISQKQLLECFTKTNGSYHVNKDIRDMCLFASHNFLKDPPFGRMDLISCRNVLIYMEPYLQRKALTTFHYSLNPKGFLLLGKTETTASVSDLFSSAAKNDKLFIRKDVPGRFMHVASQRSEQSLSYSEVNRKSESFRADFQKTADDIMLSKYTPAGVVVTEAMDIVHFRGNTSSYLEQAAGKPSHNLLKMAKHGLAFDLRSILHKVKKGSVPVIKENIALGTNGTLRSISIEAMPLPGTIEPYYLILFHETQRSTFKPRNVKTNSKQKMDTKDLRINQLEQELAQTHEDMRSITEDQEAANEELQTDNQELLSGSEELQSLNEELETSKEELQSTNEELTVVNQEIISLNEQVTAARDYAEAIVATVREPLIVLDSSLRIKTANKSFYKTFRLQENEVEGCLLFEVDNKHWNITELRTLLEKMLSEKSALTDFEITIGQRVLLLNVSEIRKGLDSENLILLAIEDITERVEDQKKMKAHGKELEEKVLLRTFDLREANRTLAFQNEEIEKRAAELIIANHELAFQSEEKEKRSAELIIANHELAFQNEEKEKRSIELMIANKELDSFTYVASHDLQEPLRKIQTFAARLLEKETEGLSEHGKDYFMRMQKAAMRMQQLITDLLSFSRLSTADRKFEIADLNEIVEGAKTDLRESIEEKLATVEVTSLSELSIIPFQFRQLMHNLISNALKFSSPERVLHIRIKGEIIKGEASDSKHRVLLSPEKKYCHISVSDNGIGFDPQFSERIFQVFQRLHGKEEYAGTGIGLAIVKKIVDNHNGVITATSQLNKGATFDIFIPTV